ncbi:electron transport complex subunit RsxB [mine drainage metagenome]|uniref:Electron transport complex subunit RsxB n=1 Tax=mine drainage metagenome TaxID=410659 RepID=A0A1J5RU72_9ZZZZ
MTDALLILSGALALGLGLRSARSDAKKLDPRVLAARIDALLPQTQCGKCGYPGCQPYAEAIVRGEADINQCPPGGAAGIARLARLLHREIKPLSAAHGVEQPRAVALIEENLCIGCTLCIQACPVDAIVGAPKQMHTVVTSLCTGCALCLPPCPVDCIRMVPAGSNAYDADDARERFRQRNLRLERERREKAARLAAKTAAAGQAAEDPKKALIAAAIERARRQKEQVRPQNVADLSPGAQAAIAAIEARRAAAGVPPEET